MKKAILLLILSGAVTGVFAQLKTAAKPVVKAAAKKTAVKPKKPAPVQLLKTTQDSLSYAIGLSVANFYKQQEITNINTALVTRAINDVNKKAKVLLDEQQSNMVVMNYMQKVKADKAAPNRKAGEAFLAANKSKSDVVTLPSGLQYQIVKEGTGPKPTLMDKVKCHYHGTLIDGTVFDSSVERGQPIELSVGGVIRGWTEALQLMPAGSKWKLFIPSNLAYGDNGAGSEIKPGSALIFDVELLEIVKPAQAQQPAEEKDNN